jgi:lysophospholipase L1-like esterase
MPPAPGLAGNTLRQALRVSIGGSRLRVHFSNEYGPSPLVLRAVQLARYTGSGAIDVATARALRFGGQPGVTIAAGQAVVSDPLEFELTPMADLSLTTWFGDVPGDLTGHPGSRMTSYIQPGDAVAAASLGGGVATEHWYVMTGIDVVAPGAAAVAILGNSITDGRGSTTNGNDRWPDMLSRRLRANPATAQVAVLNLGTGGNCVLRACLGDAGVARYRRDILDQAGVRWAIIYEGVNDIGGGRGAAASDSIARALIAAYQQLIEQGHARGLRVYGATLLPFAGSGYASPEHEAARVTVNSWIRTSGVFDAVIDFDAALRDPSDPTRLDPTADTGDHLHPNAEGYRRMGEAVDLGLLTLAGGGAS